VKAHNAFNKKEAKRLQSASGDFLQVTNKKEDISIVKNIIQIENNAFVSFALLYESV
jgi:hypothetical protein